MGREYYGTRGTDELRGALEGLLRLGRRSVAAYRKAEEAVADHRLRAALGRLRQDHERHVDELAEAVVGLGGRGRGDDGGEVDGWPGIAMDGAGVREAALLDAVRRIEAELHEAYRVHAERGYIEPIRAMLRRHRHEEAAHVEWIHESPTWRGRNGGESGRLEAVELGLDDGGLAGQGTGESLDDEPVGQGG